MDRTWVSEFDALFRAEYPVLFRRAMLVVGDAAAADDVVQDAFARAWVRWRRVRALEHPGGWLHTTTVRQAVKAAGARTAWAELVDVATDESPDSRLSGALAAALRSLSPQQRAVLVMTALDGMSSREIAQVLGCRDTTVRVHLHRARAALAALDPNEVQ